MPSHMLPNDGVAISLSSVKEAWCLLEEQAGTNKSCLSTDNEAKMLKCTQRVEK
jgi:hypothetical protein